MRGSLCRSNSFATTPIGAPSMPSWRMAEWSGFAFGFGIDRLAQMRHAVPDMRSFVENDIRFLLQF